MAKPSSQTIAFRLDPENLRRLEQVAAKNQLTAGQYARKLVLSAIADENTEPQKSRFCCLALGAGVAHTVGAAFQRLFSGTSALLSESSKDSEE